MIFRSAPTLESPRVRRPTLVAAAAAASVAATFRASAAASPSSAAFARAACTSARQSERCETGCHLGGCTSEMR